MSGIRGRWARIVREQQHEESERRAGPPLLVPATGFDMFLMSRYMPHTSTIGPVAGGKTPAGPSLFVVKP